MPPVPKKSNADSRASVKARVAARAGEKGPSRYVPSGSFSSTLAYGLDVLSALHPEGSGTSNAELAERLGLPRSTVSRLCGTLVQLGYMVKGRDGLYRPAPKTLVIAHPMLASIKVRQTAWALMSDFAVSGQVNISMAILGGTYSINISAVRTNESTAHVPEVGKIAPLEQSAAGAALLSMQALGARRSLQAAIRRERPANWKKHAGAVRDSMAECRSLGFCVSLGRYDPGVMAAAAPLGITAEGSFLALSCSLPASQVRPPAMETEWGPKVAALARGIRALDPTLGLSFGPGS